jgi:hypothetical protein
MVQIGERDSGRRARRSSESSEVRFTPNCSKSSPITTCPEKPCWARARSSARAFPGTIWLRTKVDTCAASAIFPTSSTGVWALRECCRIASCAGVRGSGRTRLIHSETITSCTRIFAPSASLIRLLLGPVSPEKTTAPSSVSKRNAKAGQIGECCTRIADTR